MRCLRAPGISSNPHKIALHRPRRPRGIPFHENVDFGADPEIFQIDSWFDGKQGAGQNASFVMGFEVVHIGAGAVYFRADGMASAMDVPVAEPAAGDVMPRRVIHFISANFAVGRFAPLNARVTAAEKHATRTSIATAIAAP